MKRKLLIGIAALSLMGMVACNLPELSVGEDNATGLEGELDDIILDYATNTVLENYEDDINSRCNYEECAELSLPLYENEELIGQVTDTFFGCENYILTKDGYILRDYEEVIGQAPTDFKSFYAICPGLASVITNNADGSYSLYHSRTGYDGAGMEHRFRIDEGYLMTAYYTYMPASENDTTALPVIKAFGMVDNQICAYIFNATTGELIETLTDLDVAYNQNTSKDIMQIIPSNNNGLLTSNGIRFHVLDTEGNLFERGQLILEKDSYSTEIKFVLYVDDYDLTASNVEQLLCSSLEGMPVYTKKDDTTHIYTIAPYTSENTEIIIDLPEGYTTSDIDKLIISDYDSLIIFKDQSIYYNQVISDNSLQKLEELTKLYQEGHVLAFGDNVTDLTVLMDDNTIYEIRN